LDAKRIKQTEEKRKQPYIPGLNAEALRLGRVKKDELACFPNQAISKHNIAA